MQSSMRAMRPVAMMTLDFVRWGQIPLRNIDLLGNVSECPQNALIADPH
jgi:hypothetical protein